MLVINPDECIDCGVCEPECPVDAIFSDTNLDPENAVRWEEINRQWSQTWPVITKKKDALPDAADWNHVPNKYEQYFSQTPGKGN